MQTSEYKLNLRSLPEGESTYHWSLGDRFFQTLEGSTLDGGSVEVDLTLDRTGEVFSLELHYEGYVVSRCDRCLDPVDLSVDEDRELVVKFGHEALEEDDEIIVVEEQDGVLDLAWVMYEDILLSLPLQHLHQEGDCNPEMIAAYDRLRADTSAEPEAADGIQRDEDGIDERWAALKALKVSN